MKLRALNAVAIALSGLLTGCSWMPFFGGDSEFEDRSPRLAEVIADLPDVPPTERISQRPSRDDVMAAYERVYGQIADRTENHAVGKRLADLKMSRGEDLDIAGAEAPYADAVSLYESLLENTEGEGKDEILYQLARASDVTGGTATAIGYLDRLIDGYPDSRYIVEARFRRAEIAFSESRYADAESDYRFVVNLGDTTPYWQNSVYMQGWAQFKLGDLEAGLASFFQVIDSVLGEADAETLPTTERELLSDSMRVVTLTLGYLDGAASLAGHMRTLDRPEWQYLVYEALADDYLEKERFLDSVATWQMFVDENGLDARAPSAHIGMIDTLVKADFPSEVRPKKVEFVNRYGVFSQFWSLHGETARADYLPTLHDYLAELSKLAHADAQTSQKRDDYLLAAEWYEQMVATFPSDPATAEYYFLLGEVYTEAQEHGRAVAAFQRVVHDFLNYERADEAGYAAILGLTELVATAPADEEELWQRLKIDAQIEFAMLFSADERASAVQGAAADSLFALGDYATAVDLAQNLLNTWPDADALIRQSALLIAGHGRFELGDFVGAENAYQRLLAMNLSGEEQAAVQERLLATIYKQGEASEAAGESEVAVEHYLRLRDIDPTAELAVQGQFDAVAVIESGGNLGAAAVLLTDFRARYPDHELGRDIEKRLAAMYEQTGDLAGAAQEYVNLSTGAEEVEVRRQSLYRAAELYLQLDDAGSALVHFRDYANTYPQPADLRLESVQHLDEIYQQMGDGANRRFWLAKKIEIYRDMGRSPTERATYLAAEAQLVFAEDERAEFDLVRISHPLQKSLKRKQQALKETVKAFEAVADYQVAEFSTASTFQIADLYSALSAEIMKSDRPSGLSELELEQYEILLEEQAFPFEEQAITLHEINMRRSWEGTYDDWVKKSFEELRRLMPARFDKSEIEVAYVETIY